MAREMKNLYVGTSRWVAAIDPRTGEEVWRTKLPSGSREHPVTILIKGQHLYVGHHGHVFCLDKRTGTLVWENGLPKMGFRAVLLAMEGAKGGCGSAVTVEHHRGQQAAAAAWTAGAAGA